VWGAAESEQNHEEGEGKTEVGKRVGLIMFSKIRGERGRGLGSELVRRNGVRIFWEGGGRKNLENVGEGPGDWLKA